MVNHHLWTLANFLNIQSISVAYDYLMLTWFKFCDCLSEFSLRISFGLHESNQVDVCVFWCRTWFSAVCLVFCKCHTIHLKEKRLKLMFHPLLLSGLVARLSRLKAQSMKNSGLLLIHRPTQASLKMLLLLWNV